MQKAAPEPSVMFPAARGLSVYALAHGVSKRADRPSAGRARLCDVARILQAMLNVAPGPNAMLETARGLGIIPITARGPGRYLSVV